jgi:hypothetical protein
MSAPADIEPALRETNTISDLTNRLRAVRSAPDARPEHTVTAHAASDFPLAESRGQHRGIPFLPHA